LASQIRPQPRLYILVLGESADDKKSTALLETNKFFKGTLTEGFQACWGVGSDVGLLERLRTTPNLCLCFDEFEQFFLKCGIKNSCLLQCVSSLYENNHYENPTKGNNLSVENAYLSLMAASTVQTYEKVWNSRYTAIGFDNRLWLVPGRGKRQFPIPVEIPERKLSLARSGLQDVLRLVGDGLKKLSLTTSAQALYDDWYFSIPQSRYAKRLDVYAMRFMPLLAVNELKDEVDQEIVEKAIALCQWQYECRKELAPIDADNDIAKMEICIKKQLQKRGALTQNELRRYVNADKKGKYWFMNACKNLEGTTEIELRDNKYHLTEYGVMTSEMDWTTPLVPAA
jgi:hypothetical protein